MDRDGEVLFLVFPFFKSRFVARVEDLCHPYSKLRQSSDKLTSALGSGGWGMRSSGLEVLMGKWGWRTHAGSAKDAPQSGSVYGRL